MPARSVVRRLTTARSIGVLAAAVALLITLAGPALAGDSLPPDPPTTPTLPEGLSPDVTLTVHFAAPEDAGGFPISGADLTVVASREGAVVQELYGVTDDAGSATITGVATATDGGADVLLDIIARSFQPFAEPDCPAVTGWTAALSGVPSIADAQIDLVGIKSVEEGCTGSGGGALPEGVVLDAALTVTILDESAQTLPGAWVTVTSAVIEQGAFEAVSAVTGDNGVATFDGLPRPDAGGPAVTWLVEAIAQSETLVAGCTQIEWWVGTAELEAVEGSSTATVSTDRSVAAGTCEDPPEGSPVLHGTILDSDGLPFPVVEATILQTRADGATWQGQFEVAGDGSFDVAVHAWGTPEALSLIAVRLAGASSRTTVDGECEISFGLVGTSEVPVALEGGAEPAPIELSAADGVIGVSCIGDESAGSAGPVPTEPATDRAAPARTGASPGLPTVVLLGALFVLLLSIRQRRPA